MNVDDADRLVGLLLIWQTMLCQAEIRFQSNAPDLGK